jgi:hypothetical protein
MSAHLVAKYTGIVATVLAAVVASLAPISGCNPSQGEGGRCNPDLASGETDCNSGLACTQPALCPENYCCPVDAKGSPLPSTNPFCQTGCSGGAASICNAGVDDAGECAFACKNDLSDLVSTAVCNPAEANDAGADAPAESSDTGADALDADLLTDADARAAVD